MGPDDARKLINEADMNIHTRDDKTGRPVRKVWRCLTCSQVWAMDVAQCQNCEMTSALTKMDQPEKFSYGKKTAKEILHAIIFCVLLLCVFAVACAIMTMIGNYVISLFV